MLKIFRKKKLDLAGIYKKSEDLLEFIPAIRERKKRRITIKFLKFFFYILLSMIFLALILAVSLFFDFKGIYSVALKGKAELEQAVVLTQAKRFSEAAISSEQADNQFKSALDQIEITKGGFLISGSQFLKEQLYEIEFLIKTAEVLSRAIGQSARIGLELDNVSHGKMGDNFSEFSQEEKKGVLKLIHESGPDLVGLKANLDLAYLNLGEVRAEFFLRPFRDKINELRNVLDEQRNLAAEFIPLSEIIPVLAGYPNQTSFLICLLNSDELRPSGGFLGTYGLLETENGDIKRLDIHDVYHLDMPVGDIFNVTPPEPLKKYLGIDKWFMRDANWSPDWPTAAKKIAWFFKEEDRLLTGKNQINNFKGEFKGVIALTPEFITDLLNLTGPVFIEGEEYNKDNFTELLEYRVEKDYIQLGIPAWQRKEVIGEIVKEIKIKLFNLPLGRWPELIGFFNSNILKKNVMVYFNDPYIEALAREVKSTGEIKNFTGDYLMVVDANLAALKTDAVITRNINYQVIASGSEVLAKLEINYKHNGNFDWRTTRYRTYTRIYVPIGSQLIKAEGGSGEEEVEVKNEADINKTSFAAFIEIEPGEIGSLKFEYKLPENVYQGSKTGIYSLYAQKQPGNKVEKFTVDLEAVNEVKSYRPTGFYVEKIKNNRIKWETDLTVDREFKINF